MKIQGIYFIRNIANDKVYVGSSINIKKRWRDHICSLNNKVHENSHLQNSWNIYGQDKFNFELVEEILDTNKLLERESYYIESKKTYIKEYGYNQMRYTDKCNRIVSEETRIKISKAKIGKSNNKGRIFSKETLKKMSSARIGKSPWNKGIKGVCNAWNKDKKGLQLAWNKGKKFSKESCKKMSEAKKGNIPWNKGKGGWHYSKEEKERLYANRKKRTIGIKRKK